MTTTSGRSRASVSSSRRIAQNVSSSGASASTSATAWPIRSATRSASGSPSRSPRTSPARPPACRRPRCRRPRGRSRAIGQKVMFWPYGRQRPRSTRRPAGLLLEERGDEPALADARRAEDGEELARPVGDDALEGVAEQAQLAHPTDQRRVEPAQVRRGVGVDALEPVGAHRRGLALEVELDRLVHVHRVADEAVGGSRRAGSRPGCGRLLEARRDVDGVAGHERLARRRVAGHDLAGVDARAQADVHAVVAEHVRVDAPRAPRSSSLAARTARRASSSWMVGTPKTAMTASPMNFSTVPPWRSMISRAAAKVRPSILRIDSGSSRSPMAVEPVTSLNRMVTVLRVSRAAGAGPAGSGEPQLPQKRKPSGLAEPHALQVAMRGSVRSAGMAAVRLATSPIADSPRVAPGTIVHRRRSRGAWPSDLLASVTSSARCDPRAACPAPSGLIAADRRPAPGRSPPSSRRCRRPAKRLHQRVPP